MERVVVHGKLISLQILLSKNAVIGVISVVVYPNGIAKKSKNFLLFKLSPKVTKGSTIRVTSKNKKSKRKNQNKVDWNQQIENAMLKISAVLTLWVLVDRVQTQ